MQGRDRGLPCRLAVFAQTRESLNRRHQKGVPQSRQQVPEGRMGLNIYAMLEAIADPI